jgi:hypothetical protein
MFDKFIESKSLSELNQYQKAMTLLRANAKTKSQKIDALTKQIKYFDLLAKVGSENDMKQYRFFVPSTFQDLTSREINKVWTALKPKYQKSKKSAVEFLNNFENTLWYLKFYFYLKENEPYRQYRPPPGPVHIQPPPSTAAVQGFYNMMNQRLPRAIAARPTGPRFTALTTPPPGNIQPRRHRPASVSPDISLPPTSPRKRPRRSSGFKWGHSNISPLSPTNNDDDDAKMETLSDNDITVTTTKQPQKPRGSSAPRHPNIPHSKSSRKVRVDLDSGRIIRDKEEIDDDVNDAVMDIDEYNRRFGSNQNNNINDNVSEHESDQDVVDDIEHDIGQTRGGPNLKPSDKEFWKQSAEFVSNWVQKNQPDQLQQIMRHYYQYQIRGILPPQIQNTPSKSRSVHTPVASDFTASKSRSIHTPVASDWNFTPSKSRSNTTTEPISRHSVSSSKNSLRTPSLSRSVRLSLPRERNMNIQVSRSMSRPPPPIDLPDPELPSHPEIILDNNNPQPESQLQQPNEHPRQLRRKRAKKIRAKRRHIEEQQRQQYEQQRQQDEQEEPPQREEHPQREEPAARRYVRRSAPRKNILPTRPQSRLERSSKHIQKMRNATGRGSQKIRQLAEQAEFILRRPVAKDDLRQF